MASRSGPGSGGGAWRAVAMAVAAVAMVYLALDIDPPPAGDASPIRFEQLDSHPTTDELPPARSERDDAGRPEDLALEPSAGSPSAGSSADGSLTPLVRVFDADGAPVPHAAVVAGAPAQVGPVIAARGRPDATRGHDVRLLFTDDSGAVRVPITRPTHLLYAWRDDLGTSGDWSATELFADPVDEVSLVLRAPALLRGRVMSSDGAPLAGAYVVFAPAGISTGPITPRLPAPVRSDANGRFVATLDAPVTASAQATHGGAPSERMLFTLAPDAIGDVLLTVPKP